MIWVGIDTGVNTGLAIFDTQAGTFLSVESCMIHEAMDVVKALIERNPGNIKIRVEDARKRHWVPRMGSYKAEIGRAKGAGSVERDAIVWEDFLSSLCADFEMVAPKDNATKLTAEAFRYRTGWKGRTNEHGRDAAMLLRKLFDQ